MKLERSLHSNMPFRSNVVCSYEYILNFISNAIKRDHQDYLRLGGLGFLLGDGNLKYGRENIVESYYTWHAWRGLFYTLDVQHINNPGYNRDRGPAWVGGARAHVDF